MEPDSSGPPDTKEAVDALSFMVGDWRGQGRLNLRTGPVEFESVLSCLKSAGGVEMVQFDDDHDGGKMFYAEHVRIAPDPGTGELVALRKGFAFADAGDRVFEMREAVSVEEGTVRVTPAKGSENFIQNDVRFTSREGGALAVEGTAKAGDETWTFEYLYVRRTKQAP